MQRAVYTVSERCSNMPAYDSRQCHNSLSTRFKRCSNNLPRSRERGKPKQNEKPPRSMSSSLRKLTEINKQTNKTHVSLPMTGCDPQKESPMPFWNTLAPLREDQGSHPHKIRQANEKQTAYETSLQPDQPVLITFAGIRKTVQTKEKYKKNETNFAESNETKSTHSKIKYIKARIKS